MRRREAGFSLIELLLVLLIIALIASIVIPNYLCDLEKARVAARQAELVQARFFVEAFFVETGSYPDTLDQAFGPNYVSPWLEYCTASNDANAGFGNDCFKSEKDNPGGNPPPDAQLGLKYGIATIRGLAPGCQQIECIYIKNGGGLHAVPMGETCPKISKPPKPPK